MTKRTLTIATRESILALWQANHIRKRLEALWPDLKVDLLPMTTSGDKFTKTKLLELGGKGLFVKELEEALLDKRADLAVHSMKDVPSAFPQGLELTTICARDNPFDALISPRGLRLEDLPSGAAIGTASLRRQSQLLAYRPDLKVKFLRGNVQTRLKKMKDEGFDAIILAAAGLERMNMDELITEILPPELMLPSCGQGALGIECRREDTELSAYLAPLNDSLTSICVQAERRVNAQLGGNCHVPLAVYCSSDEQGRLMIRGKVCSDDGQRIIEACERGELNRSMEIADRCAETLLNKGAADLLATHPE